MNTAPKLHETLQAAAKRLRLGVEGPRIADELDAIAAALAPPSGEGVDSDRREFLGKLVRMEWVAWAREQPNAKPSWLLPWEQLTEPEREVDRRIGERIYQVAVIDAATPPPASQERSGDSIVLDAYQLRCAAEFAAPDYDQDEDQRGTELVFQSLPERVIDGETLPAGMYCWYADLPEEGVLYLEEYEEYEARMTKAASPPSSAAEPDVFGVASPFDHTKHPVVRPDSFGVAGAAEQAKPDIAADDAFAAHIAKLDQDELEAEQAQAGELVQELIDAAANLEATGAGWCGDRDEIDHAEKRLKVATTAILRRLAGGVTVDDVARALVDKLHAVHDDEKYKGVWFCAHNHIGPYTGPKYDKELAALVAALGAK